MESFFSRYRNALVLIVVLVAQLLLLAVQAKRPAAEGADRASVSLMRYTVVTVITPPERIIRTTGRWIRSVWFGYIDLLHVRRDNANLRQEVERLRLEQASIAQDADQARRLQRMLGFSEHYVYKTQPAQVIGTGGTEQSQVLYIDKGSKSGLQQDMPVITADGIVGKLKDVFPHTSQVLLVTDPTSGVGVILENTRIRGILKGRAYGQLQVTGVSPDSRIKPGEPIVTSGGDQIFPRGLPVGTVDKVIPDPEHDPDVDVLVRPAAGLSQLEEVLVITDMTGTISPQEAKDLAESEAEGEAAMKRASDVLSERLPSRIDPTAPPDTNPEDLVDAAGNALRKMPPPKPEHPDGFSPNSEPDAAQMTPGQRSVPVRDGVEDMPPGTRPRPTQAAAGASTARPAQTATAPAAARSAPAAPVPSATRPVQSAPAPSAAGAAPASVTPKPIPPAVKSPPPAVNPAPAAPAVNPPAPAAKPSVPTQSDARAGAPAKPGTPRESQSAGTQWNNLPATQVIEDGPAVRPSRNSRSVAAADKPAKSQEPDLNTESQPLPDIPESDASTQSSPQWRIR